MAQDFSHIVLDCPSALVGRLIGKHGLTIKGIQIFTRVVIDVNQSLDPAVIKIMGNTQCARMAECIIQDIVGGTFKGFGNLRDIALAHGSRSTAACDSIVLNAYAYAPGLGLLPRHQLYAATSSSSPSSSLPSSIGGSDSGGNGPSIASLACYQHNQQQQPQQQQVDQIAREGGARAHVLVVCPLSQYVEGAIKVSGILSE